MTRGRKKDLTIPPTRALAQQRDYRARKAHYVSELEARCHKAEEENLRLRKELDLIKGGSSIQTANFNIETAQASSELMHNLSVASASLARFQHLAFSQSSTDEPMRSGDDAVELRPTSFPSPAPSPREFHMVSTSNAQGQKHKRPHIEASRVRISRSPSSESPQDTSIPSVDPSLDLDCCGGFLDCRDLVEDENDNRNGGNRDTIPRTSEMRFTSESNLMRDAFPLT